MSKIICKNCKQDNLEYFPVEVNSNKKRFGGLAITFLTIGMIGLIVCALILLININSYHQAITNTDSSMSGVVDATVQTAGVIAVWISTVKAIKIFAIIASVAIIVYLILPYKRIVKVFAVCQNCGTRYEMVTTSNTD